MQLRTLLQVPTCLIPSMMRASAGLRRIIAEAASCKWPIRTQNDCMYNNTELAAARIKRLSFSNRKSSPANHLKLFVIKLPQSSNTKARATYIYLCRPLHSVIPHHGDNLKLAKGRWSLHCTHVKPTTQKPLSLTFAFPPAHELYIIFIII